MQLQQIQKILYEIKINREVNFLKDLYREEEIREIIAQISRRSRCKKSVLINILESYVLGEYVYDDSEYCQDRFLNSVKKVLGRKGREVDGSDIRCR